MIIFWCTLKFEGKNLASSSILSSTGFQYDLMKNSKVANTFWATLYDRTESNFLHLIQCTVWITFLYSSFSRLSPLPNWDGFDEYCNQRHELLKCHRKTIVLNCTIMPANSIRFIRQIKVGLLSQTCRVWKCLTLAPRWEPVSHTCRVRKFHEWAPHQAPLSQMCRI